MRISDWSSDVCSSDLTRPGSSVVKVTGSAFSTTTPTSAGGASGGAASPPQPANISTATPSNIRVVLDSSMLHPARLENDGMNVHSGEGIKVKEQSARGEIGKRSGRERGNKEG